MAASLIGWIWTQEVSSTAKLVLFALNEHTNIGEHGDWRIFPSQERIARMCGVSRRTVVTARKELTDKQVITVAHQHDDNGRQLQNLYWIQAPKLLDGGVQIFHTGGCNNFIHGGENSSHKSLNKNPLIKTPLTNDLFAIFWDNYPRKTNKKLAQSAFKTAVKDEDTLNSIITNIQERIEGGDWELNNKGFIPHPSTYLNGRRWEDEVVPRTTHKPNSTEIARRNSQAVSDDFTKVSEDFAWIGKN
jgi:hypothetical protein